MRVQHIHKRAEPEGMNEQRFSRKLERERNSAAPCTHDAKILVSMKFWDQKRRHNFLISDRVQPGSITIQSKRDTFDEFINEAERNHCVK